MKTQNRARLACLAVACALVGSHPQRVAGVGANTPFSTLEGEAATLTGGAAAIALTAPPTTRFTSPELEASGHAYAQLTATGQAMTWTNLTGANWNGINVRFCIPDAAGGGGITATLNLYVNGTFRQAITLSSAQEWLYETASDYNGQSNTPSYGTPHRFWDDTHILITGAPVAPGSTVTLQKDAANTAAYYSIDCVDLEAVPAPLAQPANSLSVTTYGATGNGSTDDTAAINQCLSAAKSQNKSVWFPAGKYITTATLSATGLTIEGAGVWYTTIYGRHADPNGNGFSILQFFSCAVRNLALDSNAAHGAGLNGAHVGYGVLMSGSNWLVDNLWCQHTEAGAWMSGQTGTIQNSRMLDTWGDGINLNNGNGTPNYNSGNNLTAQNNFIRGSQDDGLAINSATVSPTMTNITIRNNTSVAPTWANGIGIYGGVNDLVTDNLVTDSVKETGINVGVFGNNGSPLVSGIVQGNSMVRCGSFGFGVKWEAMKVGTTTETNSIASLYVAQNLVSNSMFYGINVVKTTGDMVVENNVVSAAGGTAVQLDSRSAGTVWLNNNVVTNVPAGQTAYGAQAGSAILVQTLDQYTCPPIEAASYNVLSTQVTPTITPETCAEGGLDLGTIRNGSYTGYNAINLSGATSFVARVACYLPAYIPAGTITVRIDDPGTGTVIGTCSFNGTGGWQNWATVSCPVSGATGIHNVYLCYTAPMNIEWFQFHGTTNVVGSIRYNAFSGPLNRQACSEGGLNITNVTDGSWLRYNAINLDGATAFAARVADSTAAGQPAGTISICLDSPTATPVGIDTLLGTGGGQTYTTQSCTFANPGGIHDVYLVFHGAGTLPNLAWFAFPGGSDVVRGSSFNAATGTLQTENCSEGGLDVDNVTNNAYLAYYNVNLNAVTAFDARVASAVVSGQPAGTLTVRLDSPTGTAIATAALMGTGGWQTWSTQSSAVSGAGGFHDVYLVFTGTGPLPNLQWFQFQTDRPVVAGSSFNNASSAIQTQGCSEGGLNVNNVTNGAYVEYNNLSLGGIGTFTARVASAANGGTLKVCLDSPTGTVIGTLNIANTGGWQTWRNYSCALTGASGYHNVYLVFTGTGALPNLQWFRFN